MTLEECRDRLLKHTLPILNTSVLPLREAFGRILAEEIRAPFPVPGFPRSAMDGYGVKARDTLGASREKPARLKVLGELHAGDYAEIPYEEKSAVRVMTGAFIPEGFDAVVMQEDTDFGEETVSVYQAVEPFQNYCPLGEEIEEGQLAMQKGKRIGRAEAGLLASLGIGRVSVRRPLRVGIMSTGSELLHPHESMEPGRIYGSISAMLCFSVESMGFEVVREELCPDSEEEIIRMIRELSGEADLILTTGGLGPGKKDLLLKALSGLGAQILFSGADVKPGTPTAGCFYRGRIILCLSGNPFAALANFDYYFPYLASKYTGSEDFLPVEGEAVLQDPYPKKETLRRLIRARIEDGKAYLPAPVHKASVFGNTALCNGYIDLEPGRAVSPGETVRVRMLRGFL